MIKPGPVAHQPRLDLAPARSPGELAEQQRQKLALAVQTAHPEIGPVLVHKPVKNGPGNMFGQFVKYTILMAHGVALHFVSQTRQKRLKPSRINVMPLV